MLDSWTTLSTAEALWKKGKDAEAQNALILAEQEALNDADKLLEYGRLLLRMRRLWLLKQVFRKALDLYPADHRFPDLLVDLFFQIGDADSALEAYRLAKARGLPSHSHAIRRVTRVAIWCGRLDELQEVLGDPSSSDFEAESFTMLTQERIAYEQFDKRRVAEIGDAPPSFIEIQKSAAARDLHYASHLYTVATVSTSICEKDLLDIAYKTSPPAGNVSCKLAFMGWRLRQRFPISAAAKLFTGAFGLLPFGDAYGARELLEESLDSSNTLRDAGAVDVALHLATSCSAFGALPERRVAEICGLLWHDLVRKDYSVLANSFASRSVRLPILQSSVPKKPRVAVCLSGQLRSYLSSWPVTKAALKGMDVTYFVSTWDNTGAGFGTGDSVTRKLPDFVRNKIASAFQTRSFFSTRYPNTFSQLNESNKITPAECREYFNTPFVDVSDEQEFEKAHGSFPGLHIGGSLNQAKMYYGIHSAILMKKNYELEHGMQFDAVIRTRPDLEVKSVGHTDVLIPKGGNIAMSTHLRLNAFGDVFLLMSTEVADLIGSMWPAIESAKTFSIVPGASGAAAETALFETLCWNGVRLRQLRDSKVLSLCSVEIRPDHLWALLKTDLATAYIHDMRILDEPDLSIASAASEAAGDGPITSLSILVQKLAPDNSSNCDR